MPGIARGHGADTVNSPDGSGRCCAYHSTQYTEECSDNVFINGIGVVRLGDNMRTHNYPGPCCDPHNPPLDTSSATVFVNGRAVGRIGDAYGGNHIIISCSPNVNAG